MAHYLVTGGCGFIGSHLCEALLARGDRVRILDDLSTGKLENKPKNAELVRGDIADPATGEQAMKAVDGCFHLAAVASVDKANRGSLAIFGGGQQARDFVYVGEAVIALQEGMRVMPTGGPAFNV